MKKWSVKHTGKLQLFLIFTVVSALLIMLFFIIILLRSYKDVKDSLDFLKSFFIVFLPFILIWISIYAGMIRKRRIPLSIVIDEANQKIQFFFRKGEKEEFSLDEVSYKATYRRLYCALNFYVKITATRGHKVHLKYMELIVFRTGAGWKTKHIREIESQLKKENVDVNITPGKSFLQRILD